MMINLRKKMTGATLLEILLVLAVAAMILVLSIRYYQGAKTVQQQNDLMGQVTAITAAGDHYAMGLSDGYTNIAWGSIERFLPKSMQGSPLDPWNGPIAITGTPTAMDYEIKFDNVPQAECEYVLARLDSDHYVAVTPCSGTSGLHYKYNK